METPTAALNIVTSLWDQLINAPSHLLLLIVLLMVGMMMKKSPLPNWLIPWVLVLSGVFLYPMIASPMNMAPSFREGSERQVLSLYGALIGAGSVGCHRLLRRFKWFCTFEAAFVNAFREPSEKETGICPENRPDYTQDVERGQ